MRLFVGVWLPEPVGDALAAVERPRREGVRWTTPDQWHVTLRFLGAVDDPEPVQRALAEAVASGAAARADAQSGQETVAFGRHLLVVPVAGLDPLAAAVVTATTPVVGPLDEGRRFQGHVTLARCKGGDARRLAGAAVEPVTWPVPEIALIRSETRPEGARYETVAAFPLRG